MNNDHSRSSATFELSNVAEPSRAQHMIWELRKSGRDDEADQLEKEGIKAMKTGIILPGSQALDGDTGPKKLRLEAGFSVVAKRDLSNRQDPDYHWASNSRSEEAAYRADRLIGADLVPITVQREIEGKMYSLGSLALTRPDSFSTRI